MSDPTLALTFGDMIIRVADYLGIAYLGAVGGEAAQVPTDAHDLDLCKRLVNDGYRRFLTSNTRWRFLTPNITIAFVAGTSTYDMPAGFYGSVIAPFVPTTGNGRPTISAVPESYIRQMQAAADVSGDPSYVAFRPKTATATTVAPRWEAVFWPTPSAVYSVAAPARLFPDKLVNLTDTPVAGFQHGETILAFALAEAERQRDDKAGVQTAYALDALKRSKATDAESAPRRRGYNGDGSDAGGMSSDAARRPWFRGVDNYNGTPV